MANAAVANGLVETLTRPEVQQALEGPVNHPTTVALASPAPVTTATLSTVRVQFGAHRMYDDTVVAKGVGAMLYASTVNVNTVQLFGAGSALGCCGTTVGESVKAVASTNNDSGTTRTYRIILLY